MLDIDVTPDEPNGSSHVCVDKPDRNGVKDSKKSYDVSEKLPENLLSINIDAPEPEGSTSLEITQLGAIHSESGEKFIVPKGMMGTIDTHLDFTIISAGKTFLLAVVESIPSSSTKCENQGLLGTCVLCSKIKRYISMYNLDKPKFTRACLRNFMNIDL